MDRISELNKNKFIDNLPDVDAILMFNMYKLPCLEVDIIHGIPCLNICPRTKQLLHRASHRVSFLYTYNGGIYPMAPSLDIVPSLAMLC